VKIERFFTKGIAKKTVYELFDWKSIDVVLKNHSTGETILEMKNLEFPENYSQNACDIVASKFFRKSGVEGTGHEVSVKQTVSRMVNFWVASMLDGGIIDPAEEQVVKDELTFMLLDQRWAPNSPQWFNTGLDMAYGIKGRPNGHFYFDIEKGEVVESDNSYTRTQGSACFIISIEDSLVGDKSLTDTLVTESRLFKYGSGVGSNLSKIRAKNEKLSGGGKSSGLLSFLKVLDKNAGAIKSGGTTRRAAKMNVLDMNHPEILDYINWKAKEEDKVAVLGAAGYDMGIDGEAYDTVSGQNVNNSVRIPDSFMKQLLEGNDREWKTFGRTDNAVNNTITVDKLWDAIAKAAHRCGDPGVQFENTINSAHTCPAGEDGEMDAYHNQINASNPCSEYFFLDDTACNLASINVLKFYDQETGKFDIEGYCHAIGMIQLVLEATIHWGQFPTADIARKSHKFRTTGLGLTNMGALFMAMGLPYDSDEARSFGAALCSVLTGQSYYASAVMAGKVGAFECYDMNKKPMLAVLRNQAGVAGSLGNFDLAKTAVRCWENALKAGEEHGFRNAQVTCLAPTGTIAFAMDCDSTSSEPFFSHIAYKKLVGGGVMTTFNQVIATGLKTLGYDGQQIDGILKYIVEGDGKIEDAPHLRDEHLSVFDTASKCGSGKRYISPEAHVKMVGALSPHLSGGISKTVNMPAEASVQDVKDIYELSWKLGVKAITVYRDGCKGVQPLSASKATTGQTTKGQYAVREDLPDEPKALKNRVKIGGHTLHITRAFYDDGRLGEVFVTAGKQGNTATGLIGVLSKVISKSLQYGVPAEVISTMLRSHDFAPNGIVSGHQNIKMANSISDLISKFIDISVGNYNFVHVKPDEYVSNGQDAEASLVYGETCHYCGSDKMMKTGTCLTCTLCGSNTGCS